MRIRLTGRPTTSLWPSGVKEKRAWDARVLVPVIARLLWIFLECADDETGARNCVDDLAEPPETRVLLFVCRRSGKVEVAPAHIDMHVFVEVALAPVHQPVDTWGNGMLVEKKQVAALTKRRCDSACPGVEVVQPVEHALACVDEIEPSAPQLARQRLHIAF